MTTPNTIAKVNSISHANTVWFRNPPLVSSDISSQKKDVFVADSFPFVARAFKPGQVITEQGFHAVVEPEGPSDFSDSTLLWLGAGLVVGGVAIFLGAPVTTVALIGTALLASGCQAVGPDISFSAVSFNDTIAGDLRPSASKDPSKKMSDTHYYLNNGSIANEPRDELHPDLTANELSAYRTANTLWLGKQTYLSRGLNLSWELIFENPTIEEEGALTNINKIRMCKLFEHPETGEALVITRGDGEQDDINEIIPVFLPLYTGDVKLKVCQEGAAKADPYDPPIPLDQGCAVYSMKDLWDSTPTEELKNMGCYLEGKLPREIFNSDASLTMYFTDPGLKSDAEPVRKLVPDIKLIDGCRTITRELTYNESRSRTLGTHLWSWDPDKGRVNLGAKGIVWKEFFDPTLLVTEARACIETDQGCTPIEPSNIWLSDRYCPTEPGVFQLKNCDDAAMRVSPTSYHGDTDRYVVWSVGDGKYSDPPRWAKDAPLKIQLKTCETNDDGSVVGDDGIGAGR